MLAALLVAIVLVALALHWVSVTTRPPCKDFPPGPRFPLPVVGDAISLGKNIIAGFERLRLVHGDVYGLYLGRERTVVVSDFELVQEVGARHEFANRQVELRTILIVGKPTIKISLIGFQQSCSGVPRRCGKKWGRCHNRGSCFLQRACLV